MIIGSTRPLGLAALALIAERRARYLVDGLVDEGAESRLLAEQVLEFTPLRLGVVDEYRIGPYRGELSNLRLDAGLLDWELADTAVLAGPDSVAEICADDPELIVVDSVAELEDPISCAVASSATLIVVCQELADQVSKDFPAELASGRIVLASPGDGLAAIFVSRD